jgi:cytoskeleton protein RodZ
MTQNQPPLADSPAGNASDPSRDDDSVRSVQKQAVPVDPARALADEIFREAAYKGEALRTGQVLRRVREALGYELSRVSAETRIRDAILMSVERMEVANIPPGYLKAYVMTYARFLGLPVSEVVQRYKDECGVFDDEKAAAPVQKIGSIQPEPRRQWPALAALAAAVLVIAGGAGIYFLQPVPEESPALAGPSVVAISGARDSLFTDTRRTARQLPEHLPLEIVALRPEWIEIRAADGTIFLSRTMAPGESYFPRLNAGWTVTTRDAGAFAWRVGDIRIAEIGPDGAQVFSVSVDDQIARAAELAAPEVAAAHNARAAR